MIVGFIAVIFFVACDRFLKFLAVSGFLAEPVRIAGDFFTLHFSCNYNIAFSLPLSGTGLNLCISLIIVALLYTLVCAVKKGNFNQALGLTFIIFGAISNLIDRFRFGFVIDYLDLKYFTVFNLADVMIVGGVAGLIIILFKKKKKI